MNITSVKITKPENTSGKLLAYADITVDDNIAIHNIRIIKGDTKIFIAFPSVRRISKDGNGYTYSDTVHPLNQETRNAFEERILEEYNKVSE